MNHSQFMLTSTTLKKKYTLSVSPAIIGKFSFKNHIDKKILKMVNVMKDIQRNVY